MPYNREDRDKINAAYRRWYAKAKASNSDAWQHRKEAARERAPKYQQRRNEYARQMRAKQPERGNAYSRKYRLKVLEAKAGRKRPAKCEVCRNGKSKIHFDHCHKTGAFRGWICTQCNLILGLVKDDPGRLRKLIAYLKH